MLLSDKVEERITGIASGTAAMLMPDERTMAERDKFETKGYDPSRDSIDMSVGASMADESKGLHEGFDPAAGWNNDVDEVETLSRAN